MIQRARPFRSLSRLLAGGLSVCLVLSLPFAQAGCASGGHATSHASPRVLSAEERELNARSFDVMYDTVRTRHWDPKLHGVDWSAIHTELRPKVEAATTMDEARGVMREALARLGQSHFGIIDRDAYSGDDGDGSSGSSQSNAGDPTKPVDEGEPGIDLRIIDGKAVVFRVEDDSPARAAGVKPGWAILKAGPVDVTSVVADAAQKMKGRQAEAAMIQRAVSARLHGQVGAAINYTFLAEDSTQIEKSIVLAAPTGEVSTFGNLPPIRVKVYSTRLEGDVGYLRFTHFLDPGRVMPRIESTMQTFQSTRGIIIDLRGNPGGIGVMACGVCGYFVEKDGLKLGEMHTRDGTMNFVIFPRLEVFKGPLAVLVDPLSISTSEIMAGGLQDNSRARIFGERTAGAALPSTVEKLPNGDGFQFVVANYMSASGRVLEGEGVTPDEVVPLDRATLLQGKDPVIEAALRWIKSSSPASNQ